MGLWLKQSTAVDVLIGPFVDSLDGNTTEEALTIEDSDVLLSKNGQALTAKNDANDATHDDLGYYNCPLDSTDTNTLGALQLCCHMSGALPVYHEFMVVRADVYDTMCSTDYLQVDVIQLGSGTQSATDLKDFADTGYNPATHSVDLVDDVTTCATVTTCTTTTTNTDLTAFAANYTAARAGYLDELAAANLPTDVANVKAETALIVADTNELQTDWHDGGRLDLIIDSLALEATVAALNDIDADTVWDEVMDTNAPANANSAREIINVIASAVAGKCSGNAANSPVFRDLGDTKDRISATTDANNDRTAVTQDGT